MITLLMMQAVLRAARESGEVTEEELNDSVFNLVKWMIIFLVIGVFWYSQTHSSALEGKY